MIKNSPVSDTDTVVDVWTVMIKHNHTAVTDSTMLTAQRLHCTTGMTETTERITASMLPLLKMHYLRNTIWQHFNPPVESITGMIYSFTDNYYRAVDIKKKNTT